MFEKLIADVNNFDYGDQTKVSIASNVYLSDTNFKNTLNNLDSMTDDKVYDFVKKSYKMILTQIAQQKSLKKLTNNINDMDYLNGFTNVKFLTALQKVFVEEGYKLPEDYRIYCNSIIYDYLSLDESQRKEDISNLLFTISRILNRNIINVLIGLGLSEQLASQVVLSYKSSSDDEITIPKVNYVLLHENANFMTVQRIIYIYEKLYNSITNLFKYTMCDALHIENTVTEYANKRKIYNYEADAVVTILNNMPEQAIYYVLTDFYNYCLTKNYLISDIRYSLRAMPVNENNFRVLDVIEKMYNLEGKFIL